MSATPDTVIMTSAQSIVVADDADTVMDEPDAVRVQVSCFRSPEWSVPLFVLTVVVAVQPVAVGVIVAVVLSAAITAMVNRPAAGDSDSVTEVPWLA